MKTLADRLAYMSGFMTDKNHVSVDADQAAEDFARAAKLLAPWRPIAELASIEGNPQVIAAKKGYRAIWTKGSLLRSAGMGLAGGITHFMLVSDLPELPA